MRAIVIVNNTLLTIFLSAFLLACNSGKSQKEDTPIKYIPEKCQRLIASYPDFLKDYVDGRILWKDGSFMAFDDNDSSKSFQDLLSNPDLEDQMSQEYPLDKIIIQENFDPGRFRHEAFFKKMYGSSPEEVEAKLDTVVWQASSDKRLLLFSRVNGAADSLQKVANELDSLGHLQVFLANIGGTYLWRQIAGTDRLSAHSFGICIDINVSRSHYWRWGMAKRDSTWSLSYHNDVPLEIVKIFEKYGFIWGGKWYHYDTMHFEFRPELIRRPSPRYRITAFDQKKVDSIGVSEIDPSLKTH
ncbi:MAG: M15 family metallopeptidase [Bacteroidia bacterium]|nr:M15 family metallopeptidase [Bacteroidia bacterium]